MPMIEYELKEPLNVRIFIPEINYLLQRFLYICRHPAFIESREQYSHKLLSVYGGGEEEIWLRH